MPGSKSRNRGQRKQNLSKKGSKNLGDVTINDFANASTGSHSRLKKAIANVASEVKQRLIITEDPITENDEFPKIRQTSATSSEDKFIKKKSGKSDEKEVEEAEGLDYPLDLWFLISEHICPESVGKFARICKKSNYVTHTAKFWFHLSKRFHKSVPDLPQHLQPGRICRPLGLRATVIRALHFSYYRFLKGPDNKSRMEQKDPYSLVKRRCSLMWHRNKANRWYFFFKLKESKSCKKDVCVERLDENENQNFELSSHNAVIFNPEEDCKILRVTCLQYNMVQPVIGLTLQTVSVSLSPELKHHRLVLGFGNAYMQKIPTQMITLVGVVCIDVLDWWQIQYPYQEVDYSIFYHTAKTPTYDSWEQMYSGIRDKESLIYA